MENWQSEFLQFSLLILATVWFVQRGSTESKKLDDAGQESDKEERVGRSAPPKAPRWAKVKDWRARLYENSLGLAMVAIFFGTWFAQSVTNWTAYNNRQTEHGEHVGHLGVLPRPSRLLEPHAAELAVRVPRRGHDGRLLHLPAPAWVGGVEARGRPTRRDRLLELT